MSSDSISVEALAPGKVNLFFAVGGVREDGYHPVASLYSAVSMYERVVLTPTQRRGITISASIAEGSLLDQMAQADEFDLSVVPLNNKNLAYKAAELLLLEQNLTVLDVSLDIHLVKAVPVAGGMGGGSADAAATLRAMNEYLVRAGLVDAPAAEPRILEIAATLGADVPFAYAGGLAVGMGVGDELTHVEVAGGEDSALNLVMVASTTGLSTPAVFAELDAGREQNKYPAPGELNVPEELLEALTSTGAPIARLHEISRYLRNDLQEPALTLQPELAKTLGFQDAQIVASFVSGSGPTIALLMESEADAEALAKSLRRRGRYAVAVKTPAEA